MSIQRTSPVGSNKIQPQNSEECTDKKIVDTVNAFLIRSGVGSGRKYQLNISLADKSIRHGKSPLSNTDTWKMTVQLEKDLRNSSENAQSREVPEDHTFQITAGPRQLKHQCLYNLEYTKSGLLVYKCEVAFPLEELSNVSEDTVSSTSLSSLDWFKDNKAVRNSKSRDMPLLVRIVSLIKKNLAERLQKTRGYIEEKVTIVYTPISTKESVLFLEDKSSIRIDNKVDSQIVFIPNSRARRGNNKKEETLDLQEDEESELDENPPLLKEEQPTLRNQNQNDDNKDVEIGRPKPPHEETETIGHLSPKDEEEELKRFPSNRQEEQLTLKRQNNLDNESKADKSNQDAAKVETRIDIEQEEFSEISLEKVEHDSSPENEAKKKDEPENVVSVDSNASKPAGLGPVASRPQSSKYSMIQMESGPCCDYSKVWKLAIILYGVATPFFLVLVTLATWDAKHR